mmetsp:Transcript_13652/g.10959  ORF Transcript_13652/g.10959 Transcript_13652/m.10959 type:complete len:80 (-) Transcript_13652:29-268(-)
MLEPKWLRTPPLRNGMTVFFFFFFFFFFVICDTPRPVALLHLCRLATRATCPRFSARCSPDRWRCLSQNGYGPPRYVTA